jgi:hypothetical protein
VTNKGQKSDGGEGQSCPQGNNPSTTLVGPILNHYSTFQASKKLDDGTRYDVLELLGQLEGELQAKDIAIATLKVFCKLQLNYGCF